MGVGGGMFDGLAAMFFWGMVFIFFVGVSVALFFVYGMPWIWHIVKPILHAWTAAT